MSSLLFSAIYANSQDIKTTSKDTTITFKVFGVCEQCKHRIEGALKVKGITSADWNIDTKLLTISYNLPKISIDKIHNKITGVGHDTYLKNGVARRMQHRRETNSYSLRQSGQFALKDQ